MNDKPPDRKIHKPHSFNSSLRWTGSRTWLFKGAATDEVPGGPPPVFGGIEGQWSPEELMLASVNSCTVSTFISYSLRKNFEFLSLESSIEGTLEFDGKGYVFTRMVVRPKVSVKTEADIQTAIDYLHKAHEACFMGNSVKAIITIEPEVTVGE